MEDRKYPIKAYLYDQPELNDQIQYWSNDTDSCSVEIAFYSTSKDIFSLENKTVSIVVTKPDGTSVTAMAVVTGENTALWQLTTGELTVGTNKATIQVYSGTERLTFGTFKYKVLVDPEGGQVGSENNYPILVQLINDVQSALNSVSQTNENISQQELTRENNEENRVNAENIRISNETDRINRFNTMTTEQQQDMEVVDARQGKATLRDNIQDIKSQLAEKTNDYIVIYDTDVDIINTKIINATILKQKVKFGNLVQQIDKPIIVPSNAKIDFQNTIIQRKTGSGAFDLIRNEDLINGNTGIRLYNLNIDGNKDIDSLVATNDADRFSGLKFVKVTSSRLKNIDVQKTVNAEEQVTTPAAGVYFEDCSFIQCCNVNGSHNDRTAIFLNRSRVKIDGSITHDNLGSGISSANSDECEYCNIETYNNGYSNLSVNGNKPIINNIRSYGSAYSGVNIGHNGFPSDDAQVSNVISYNNGYEGLTIAGSANVQCTNINVWGNARNNIRIFDGATAVKLLNVDTHDSVGGQGIMVESGTKHIFNMIKSYRNYLNGIYCNTGTEGKIGDLVDCYNNGVGVSANSAGILLNTVTNWIIGAVKCYDDQTTKTQESGIWIAGGGSHLIKLPRLTGNKIYDIRKTSSPTNLIILNEPVAPVTVTGINGWTVTGTYSKTSDGMVVVDIVASGGMVGNSCFNLPIGFRPSKLITLSTQANNTYAYIEVSSGGDIKPYISNISHNIYIVFKSS